MNREREQLGLFAGGARRSDPVTSHRAVRELVSSGRQATQQARVLAALRELGGWRRASELAPLCHLDAYTVRKRLPELERLGAVVRSRIIAAGDREQMWKVSA